MKRLLQRLIQLFSMSAMIIGLSLPLSASGLTNDTKAEYYRKYKEVVEAARNQYKIDLTLAPIEEVEDFITPEELKEIIDQMGRVEFEKDVAALKPDIIQTKLAEIITSSLGVSITCQFETEYAGHADEQYLGKEVLVTSVGTDCSFEQKGYEVDYMDAKRAATVTVQGNLTYKMLTWHNVDATAEFYCSAAGGIY